MNSSIPFRTEFSPQPVEQKIGPWKSVGRNISIENYTLTLVQMYPSSSTKVLRLLKKSRKIGKLLGFFIPIVLVFN
jgi:hypothetical protein